jgi:hypothetical protein
MTSICGQMLRGFSPSKIVGVASAAGTINFDFLTATTYHRKHKHARSQKTPQGLEIDSCIFAGTTTTTLRFIVAARISDFGCSVFPIACPRTATEKTHDATTTLETPRLSRCPPS